MNEVGAVGQGGVHAGDDEGRRRDPATHFQGSTDTLSERGLTGPQPTGEHHEVAGAQQAGQASPECPGLIGVAGGNGDPGGGLRCVRRCAHVPSSSGRGSDGGAGRSGGDRRYPTSAVV